MEGPSITQLLKGFCDDTQWKYAVLWKLNNQFPMTLTWENGYYGYQKSDEVVESAWGDINFKFPNEVYSSSGESTDDSGDYSAGLLMNEMFHLKYSYGEGVVGKIALSTNHCWVFCEDIITGKFDTNLIPECPDEWLFQFASGIKTIVLVPVLPQGVLQFGSFEKVAEDLEFVTNIKEKFYSAQCPAESATHLGINYHDWTFSALTDTLMDSLEESSSISNSILKGEVSGSMELTVNGSGMLNPIIPSFIQDDSSMSGENPLNEISSSSIDQKHVALMDTKMHMEDEIWACSPWINNVGVSLQMTNGFGSYSGKSMREQKFGGIDTSHDEVKNVNEILTFPSESELHKALGSVANKQTGKSIMSKCMSVEDTYSRSTLISNREDQGHVKGLESPEEVDPEYLLDAVIGNLFSVSDDTSTISFSVRSPITKPIELTGSIQPKFISDESTSVVKNSDLRIDQKPAVMVKNRDDFAHHFSVSSDGNSTLLVDEGQQEKVYSHTQPTSRGPKLSSNTKKRARAGNNTQRSRPRDRQMIMDRMKELRELVPDGDRCSIDNLLERTIKHMLYLRKITNQAEKLEKCGHREVPERKKQKINGYHPGRSCAFEFESELPWPIIIEDLECSGHMLIEMVCNEHGLFLEIAQVIRKLDLTILRGVLENHSSTTWARFIVEAPRGFHRMDVLCPLLHLLQLRRNPILCKG